MTQKILLVDDHTLLSETLSVALRDEDIDVVIVTTIDAAIEAIDAGGAFDVVFVDYEIPGESGLDGLKRVIDASTAPVVLFSGVASQSIAEQAISMGARGFLPKTVTVKTLKHAIRFIADGEIFVPASFSLAARSKESDDLGLRPREERVLALLGEGMPNKEIGRRIDAPESTVKLDVKSICRKLGVKNRTQAVIAARRLRMI